VNLAGVEDGLEFWGGRSLVGPTGDVLAKAEYDQEDFLICEADFSDLRTVESFVPTLRDLRPEFYDKLRVLSEQF
jgi:predicted amidohydrolase